MSLTLGGGPLTSAPPGTVNYDISGPPHRLFWQDFPRRVRGLLGNAVVVDSRDAKLLHESNLLPQLYFPSEDVRTELLEDSEHWTHCPFKGDATYRSLRVNGIVAENAVWTYAEPKPEASWLAGHEAVHWQSLDAWFDEDEEVFGHIRDPYHRVDVRDTTRHVRVVGGDVVLAETRRAKLLSETGLPNRFYVPVADARTDLLEPSATHTVCPYKGTASYQALRTGDASLADVAWTYPQPLDGVGAIAGHLCFHADGVDTWVDGELVD